MFKIDSKYVFIFFFKAALFTHLENSTILKSSFLHVYFEHVFQDDNKNHSKIKFAKSLHFPVKASVQIKEIKARVMVKTDGWGGGMEKMSYFSEHIPCYVNKH